jgi:hypothetical protein
MKKNFRCTDDAAWEAGLEKAEAMRREGYDIDMTSVLNSAVRQFADEKPEQSAARFGLTKGDQPVAIYRKPLARSEPVGQ